ncbi:MAG: DUF523 domain-containing protein [Myxococcales bacterium]|nr:DUF523 domain-containing protein [Myxococcales bacterium]
MRARILVSRCLLGDAVRYDGRSKPAARVAGLLALAAALDAFEVLPVCPEVEAGLGTPRPPIDLVRGPAGLRVVDRAADRDVTDALDRVAAARLAAPVHGFVGKARSPSCGQGDAACYDAAGRPLAPADGRFAAGVRARWAHAAICSDETLDAAFVVDAALAAAGDGSPSALLDFHGRFGEEWSAGAGSVTRERLAAYAVGGARRAYGLLLGAAAADNVRKAAAWSASC